MTAKSDASSRRALAELAAILDQVDPDALDRFAKAIHGANCVHCFGLGREGLMLRALTMRLMHLGFDVHQIGDVTAPPASPGDLVIVASGPGDLTLAHAMIRLGRRTGATTLVVTAQPDGPDPRAADLVFTIPAQTMADDRAKRGVLPMGTAFEIAMLLFFDLAAIRLRELTGQTDEQIRARHTNLE